MSSEIDLLKQMQSDMIAALKSGEKDRAEVLRLIIAEIKTAQINAGKDLEQESIFKLIRTYSKALEEAARQYKSIGNTEAASREEFQISVLNGYLPKMMSEKEISDLVDNVVSELGVSGMAAMGQVIGAVMAKSGGRADGSTVQNIVKQKLSS